MDPSKLWDEKQHMSPAVGKHGPVLALLPAQRAVRLAHDWSGGEKNEENERSAKMRISSLRPEQTDRPLPLFRSGPYQF